MGKITGLYTCPRCSRPVNFRSVETRLLVCVCGAVIHRLESDDLVIKDIPVVSGAIDLIQPGSGGRCAGRSFEVLGRFRLWLSESVINYWTICFEDGATGLLAEGYGQYRVLRRRLLDIQISAVALKEQELAAPLKLVYPDDYYIRNKDECWRYEIEGEVLMPECNAQFPVFDCYAYGGKVLEIMEMLPGYLVVFEGRSCRFGDLELKDLNDAEPSPWVVQCPQCRDNCRVNTYPYAQSCSCSKCGARMSMGRDGQFRLSGKDSHNQNNLDIALGTKGMINDISYEVIGYAKKKDDTEYGSFWKEYVLYNRAEGYAFLSEYGGNWIYVREEDDCPTPDSDKVDSLYFKEREFQLYNKYGYSIVDTAGEFPYDNFDEKKVESVEWISPPYMWNREHVRNEKIEWFHGERVQREVIQQQLSRDIPWPTEVDHLEPRGYVEPGLLVKVGAIAFAVMTVVHLLITFGQDSVRVNEVSIQFKDSSGAASYVSPTFELTKWRSNIEFAISSNVDNSWVDMDLTLVNSKDGSEQAVQQLVEYYHGYDDGAWSEGSADERAYITGISPGVYFLRIDATRDVGNVNPSGGLTVLVTSNYGSAVHRNYVICLIILVVWLVSMYQWVKMKDKRRWENSPYSPYNE